MPQILSITYFVKPIAKLKLSETLKMGSEAEIPKKPRFLCLHGFRTSGKIFKIQSEKWPQQVLEKLDLVFPDAPFPSQGKSEVEGIFDPPYYEWFQFNKEFTEYINFDECLAYIEDFMIKHGPFDGLMGFSQGAILSAGLIGLQAKGVALTKVSKIKFLIIIGGAKFKSQSVAEIAYASPIQCPNLHFLGITFFSIFLFLILFESIYLITTLIQLAAAALSNSSSSSLRLLVSPPPILSSQTRLFSPSSSLCMRHGATLAAGEVVLALHQCDYGWRLGVYCLLYADGVGINPQQSADMLVLFMH
ncbi:hypothetical protein Patl1_08609 [Pistacia atlantica]|uniref:Uncharacterized protein n=1 Tax=Pistacia atlantica TaxID=434234 RepID=A0ACC1AL96_9ROSI|nr:hypothetical protein Patl1_08609 [Pistacia atlantica]